MMRKQIYRGVVSATNGISYQLSQNSALFVCPNVILFLSHINAIAGVLCFKFILKLNH